MSCSLTWPKVRLGTACLRGALEIVNGAWSVSQPFFGASWSCRALIVTTLEIVVSEVRGTIGKEQSFKANRRQKFSECLPREDVYMAKGSSSSLLLLLQFPIKLFDHFVISIIS